MSKTEVFGLIRHALTFGAGYLVAKGLLPSAEVNDLVGAIVTVLTVIWSVAQKRGIVK